MAAAWWGELRTAVAGVDPGLERMRLAAIGSASMVLAVAVMAGVRALTGQPVTLLVFAAVLAMISNLAVNEPELRRRRATTALMIVPAAVAVVAGTLLAPHRVVADVVFVAVTVAAVYVRRFGPRGFALGMAGFMPYFFTQFLQAKVAELPWLVVAAATGLGSTLLLRGFVFAEQDEKTLVRLVGALRAHVHAVVVSVAGLLAAAGGPAGRVEAAVRDTRRRRARLNTTALLVADRLDRLAGDDPDPAGDALGQRMLDVELAAERLAIATRRLAEVGGPRGADRDPLMDGLRGLAAATATGTPHAMVPALLAEVREAVGGLTTDTGDREERTQRVGFAVHRLADTLDPPLDPAAVVAATAGSTAGSQQGGPAATGSQQGHPAATAAPPPGATATAPAPDADRAAAAGAGPGSDADPASGPGSDTEDPTGPGSEPEPDAPRTLRLTTRQALQAGVAVALSIVAGELVSPSRWYWAAVAAFVVFAGTNSRGDILSRGWGRILGTVGGVATGMALAFVVGGRPLPALAALVACMFLALYLVRISPALMAFWLTAVLALMYGLIGQFSLQVLVLRIEETVVGALMGMLAAYVVLPRRTRDAYAEARDDLVAKVDDVLGAATDRLLGRDAGPAPPVDLARDMDDALGTLRARTTPLTGPWRRTGGGYRDTLHTLAGVDHYARALARLSDGVRAPEWAPVLQPAVDRVRANVTALATPADDRPEPQSAEELIDAAEAWAARHATDRHALLEAVRLLRRVDQAVLTLQGVRPASALSPTRP